VTRSTPHPLGKPTGPRSIDLAVDIPSACTPTPMPCARVREGGADGAVKLSGGALTVAHRR
jgi:hypothetical protein